MADPLISATMTMESHNFESLGICIYCCKPFSVERPPTDEHIVPQYAGGTVFIRDGVCRPCALLTNRLFESKASETTFFAFKNWFHRKEEKVRGYLNMAPGDALDAPTEAFTIHAQPNTRPPFFSLPDFSPPQFWKGKAGDPYDYVRARIANFSPHPVWVGGMNVRPRLSRQGRQQIEVRAYLKSESFDVTIREIHDVPAYLLMLAKVAYCFAVATLGFDVFDGTAIRQLVRGDRTDFATFIGGTSEYLMIGEPNSLHLVHLREKKGVIYVIARLYATKLQATYEVVVGAKK